MGRCGITNATSAAVFQKSKINQLLELEEQGTAADMTATVYHSEMILLGSNNVCRNMKVSQAF